MALSKHFQRHLSLTQPLAMFSLTLHIRIFQFSTQIQKALHARAAKAPPTEGCTELQGLNSFFRESFKTRIMYNRSLPSSC